MVFDAKSDTIDPPWPSKTAKQSNFGEIFSIKYLKKIVNYELKDQIHFMTILAFYIIQIIPF